METNTPYFFVEIGKIDLTKINEYKWCFTSENRTVRGSQIKRLSTSDILLSSSEMREMGVEVPRFVDENIKPDGWMKHKANLPSRYLLSAVGEEFHSKVKENYFPFYFSAPPLKNITDEEIKLAIQKIERLALVTFSEYAWPLDQPECMDKMILVVRELLNGK